MIELKGLFKSGVGAPTAAATPGITPGSLKRIKILVDMDEKQLASFLQYLEVLKLLPNAVVFRKGDHGDAMFLVLEGELRARVMVGGQESTLATMTVGEVYTATLFVMSQDGTQARIPVIVRMHVFGPVYMPVIWKKE